MKNKMAKILFVLFCILTILNLCCCKTNDKQLSSSASSLQNNDTNSQPTENITPITSLLQTVSASDSLQDIKSIAVLDSSCIAVTTITDVNNMEFLQKYIYYTCEC